jgi:hypothetical protein
LGIRGTCAASTIWVAFGGGQIGQGIAIFRIESKDVSRAVADNRPIADGDGRFSLI